jgi:glyoxylase-like metal-dependent hydrolase (beta-lactamase superfamily II)
LGEIVVQRIADMEYPFLPPTDFFAEATAENLVPHRHWLKPHALCLKTGKLILSVKSYLVRSTRHTILIDTCIGCNKSETWLPEWLGRQDFVWLERLRSAGVHLDAVDYVFCTHLHMGHVGWNTQLLDGRWVLTFPNAT